MGSLIVPDFYHFCVWQFCLFGSYSLFLYFNTSLHPILSWVCRSIERESKGAWTLNKAKKEINTLYMHCYTQIIRLASDDKSHRISTARKVKAGSRLVFSLIEPKWPLPYCTVPVPLLRDARPAGGVTFCSICVSTMPRDQNRAAKGSIVLWRRLTLPIWE